MTERDYQEGRAFYDASFEQMDEQVGRVLDALEESGQADNTLVVFTADHGAPWGAHRMWLPCFAPYEEIYRTPMVVRWPGGSRPVPSVAAWRSATISDTRFSTSPECALCRTRTVYRCSHSSMSLAATAGAT